MKLSMKAREAFTFYTFVSPFFIIFLGLGMIPLLWGLYLSFTNYTGFNINELRIVGFKNYIRIFHDQDSMYSLGRTMMVTGISVPLGTAIGFLLAVLLNNKIKGLSLFRTLIYLPAIIPVVATGLMWKVVFNRDQGMINGFLGWFGIAPLDWLGYDLATTSLIILLLWGAGGAIIINLAGLKGISRDLYESASIDGANAVKRFSYITVPLMTPILFFNIIMGIIGSLQIMVQPVLLSLGAADKNGLMAIPIRPNYLYLVHTMQQIFVYQRFAYGLALLWVLFVFILILTVVVFRTSRYWVHYEVDQEGK